MFVACVRPATILTPSLAQGFGNQHSQASERRAQSVERRSLVALHALRCALVSIGQSAPDPSVPPDRADPFVPDQSSFSIVPRPSQSMNKALLPAPNSSRVNVSLASFLLSPLTSIV